MDNPELANLNQIELDSPMDQSERGVLARDRVTGAILVVPREIARALLRLKHGLSGDAGSEQRKQDRISVAGLLHTVQYLRKASREGQKNINPLFLRVSLFRVAPFQRYLESLAGLIVGPAYIWSMAILLAVAFGLGIQSDWAIAGAFNSIFSPQALLTFGIAAPLLKIFHELGHVLAATRFGTRVAKAGILFIALFPIPFVDCSDADVSANRYQRVVISLAGLFTDMLMGVLIFIAWHFTTGDFLRTLLGHLFVYLTLNSLLFNANPLIKLDGYFALIDLVRYRNLSQDGGRQFKSMQEWAGSWGQQGHVPKTPRDAAILGYAGLSLLYRIYIVGFIAYSLIPQYMGIGAAIVAWGFLAMFYAPLARSQESAGRNSDDSKWPIWRVRIAVLAGLLLALFVVRVPVRQDIEVVISTADHYAVTAPETARLVQLAPYGHVSADTVLTEFDNPGLREQLAERRAELELAQLALEGERDSGPARAATARERMASIATQIGQLELRLQGEALAGGTAGVFVPRTDLPAGGQVSAGSSVGAFYPDSGAALLSGQFPERYVQYFRRGIRGAELRYDGEYYALEPDHLMLQENVTADPETGRRLYVLQVTGPRSPAEMMRGLGQVRVDFRSETLWERLGFFARGLMQNLQESRLSEVERRLN